MKDVMIKITGISEVFTAGEDPQKDTVELITEAKLSKNGNITRLVYKEPEDFGDNTETSVVLTPKKIRVERKAENGAVPLLLEFQKGHRYNGEYATPYGEFDLELLTNDIKYFSDSENENKMSVDYSMSLKGLLQSDHRLEIEILNGMEECNGKA